MRSRLSHLFQMFGAELGRAIHSAFERTQMSIFPYKEPGGRVALVAEVWFLGLLWAWVANNTGVILWTAMAHILIDFSALGWNLLFK